MKKAKKKREKKVKASHDISLKRFVIIYLILMGIFFSAIGFTPLQKIIDINGLYTIGVVVVTSKFLGILSLPYTYHGSIINLPSISLDVKFGCNGLEAVMIYTVAVIAFPSTWKKKLTGILAGFVIIQIINILRIIGLVYSVIYFKNLFKYIHIYVAQGMMIAVALGIFFIYLNYAKPNGKAAE